MSKRQGDPVHPEVEITNVQEHPHKIFEGRFYHSAEVLFIEAGHVWGIDKLYGSWLIYEKVQPTNGSRPQLITLPGQAGRRGEPPTWLAAKLQDIVRPIEERLRLERADDDAPNKKRMSRKS